MFRRLFRVTLVLFALGCAPVLHAQSLVQLSVVDRDSGRTLPEWPHRGERWIEGDPGHRYALRLTNLTGARVLVVVSVDGVNAVSGQDACVDQGGYVLAPWQTTEISGWRKSLQEVAAFVFTDLPDSYAARTGRPDNVGVIGLAAFRERAPAPVSVLPDPAAPERRNDAARAAAPAAEASKQTLGTGHGERQWAPVGRTTFVRDSARPQQRTQLRYDTRSRLIALGVLPVRRPLAVDRPQAFADGFVPDP
ncbi:hypothetical protein SAMN05428989_0021 [Pseudoxanthomonas sp. GM95]|uniref:hypothetical protein n=1 Tax=Pseudoxanthomonas sp. GM95 TaxID=1881043 RepID=UPI0008BBF44A|nr:hypothetical protein [Pseudoxanthomonas sp. GM95]SEK38632.1 hypothetical protein SAMN05428989_0021 [Pseudoxanthomonas sp. GM95]